MKTMVWPSSLASSFSTALSRSSNSPRYLAPASSAAMSSDSTRLPFRLSGTSPATMRCARPSTMAVLPTPGSPMSTGLFLLRRCSTWMARRISSSRPITGSSLPARARSVRSSVYFLSASRWPSASALLTWAPPRTASIAASRLLRVRPCSRAAWAVSPLPSTSASRKSSLAMNWSPRLIASFSVACSSRPRLGADLHLVLALHLGQALDGVLRRRLQGGHVGAGTLRQRARALLLPQHGGQQVHGFDIGVVIAQRERLRVGEGFLELGGEFVETHGLWSSGTGGQLRGPSGVFKLPVRRVHHTSGTTATGKGAPTPAAARRRRDFSVRPWDRRRPVSRGCPTRCPSGPAPRRRSRARPPSARLAAWLPSSRKAPGS